MPRTKREPIRHRQRLRILRQRLSALLAELADADADAPLSTDAGGMEITPPSTERASAPSPEPSPLAGGPVAAVPATTLSDFCTRHVLFTSAGASYGHIESQRFFDTHRIALHSNGVLNLYRRYDPLKGCDVFEWHPQLFALAKVVRTKQEHAQGCNGWSGREAGGYLSKYLFRCGCPTVFGDVAWEWVVDPKTARPVFRKSVITHRQQHSVLES